MASSLKVNRVVPSTGTNIGLGTANGQIRLASTSKLTFDGDTDTYIHHPSANQLAITRAGASYPMIRFGSGGGGNTITMGNTTSNLVTNGEILSVRGYSSFKSVDKNYAAIYTHNEGNTSGTYNAHILFNASGANRGGFGYMPNTGELTLNHQNDISIRTGGTQFSGAERIRIKNDGKILIGAGNTVTPRIVSTSVNAFHQIEGTTYHESALSITRNTDDQWGGYVILGKSRGTSVGGIGTLTDGDIVGEFRFAACDGTDMVPMTALIRSEIDGAVGVNSTPGALTFRTTAPGNVSTNERLRIKADGNITTDYNIKSNNLPGRNVVINGDMRIAQRATSASMSNHGGTIDVCDRWIYSRHGVTATVAQVEEAPAGRGFKYSLKWTSTSAVGSIAAGNSLKFAYNIERQDIQRLGYGSSNGKKATLSFWAKGSLAGKIGISCTRNSRITSHNVDMTANTWEFHEIVIPIDTSTALSGNDNDSGFYIGICWGGGGNSTSGATNGWIGFHNAYTAGFTAGQQGAYLTTSGSTFQITGVQFEVGSVSTPFDHRSYEDELMRCFRYYYRTLADNNKFFPGMGMADIDGNTVILNTQFPVRMRSAPSALEQTGTANNYKIRRSTTQTCTSVPSFGHATLDQASTNFIKSSHGWGDGSAVRCMGGTTGAYLGWSAEL